MYVTRHLRQHLGRETTAPPFHRDGFGQWFVVHPHHEVQVDGLRCRQSWEYSLDVPPPPHRGNEPQQCPMCTATQQGPQTPRQFQEPQKMRFVRREKDGQKSLNG
jgi:hypothetical protein